MAPLRSKLSLMFFATTLVAHSVLAVQHTFYVQITQTFYIDSNVPTNNTPQLTIDALSPISYSDFNATGCGQPYDVVWKNLGQTLPHDGIWEGTTTTALGVVWVKFAHASVSCTFKQQCKVSSDPSEIEFVVGAFTITARDPPTVHVVNSGSDIVDPGDLVSVTCTATIGRDVESTAALSEPMWFINGVDTMLRGESQAIPVINSSTIECRVPQTPGITVGSSSIAVDIKTPPKLISFDDVVRADIGRPATLSCKGTAGRGGGAVGYQWLRENDVLLTDDENYSGTNTSQLVVRSVEHASSFRFQCEVSQAGSRLVTRSRCCSRVLAVQPPVILASPKAKTVKRGAPCTMICNAMPGNNSEGIDYYVWMKDGEELLDEGSVTISGFDTPVLSWTDVHAADAGVYACVVHQRHSNLTTTSMGAALTLKSEKFATAAIIGGVIGAVASVVVIVVILDRTHKIPVTNTGLKVRKAVKRVSRRVRGPQHLKFVEEMHTSDVTVVSSKSMFAKKPKTKLGETDSDGSEDDML